MAIIEGVLRGPAGHVILRLLLNTGAAFCMLRPDILLSAGYDLDTPRERMRIATVSKIEIVPVIRVQELTTLGQTRRSFAVLSHELPLSATIDGVLGLNFLRGHILTVDFRAGVVRLE